MGYCTHCGHPLKREWVKEDARERDICTACDAVHYDNPKILVGCLVHWQRKIILCRRAVEPAKGYWYPPTGFVEFGETLEEAATRELFEEAGLSVDPAGMHLYSVVSLPHMNQIYVSFLAELSDEPTLVPGRESLEVCMFAEDEIPYCELAFKEMSSELLPNFFSGLRRGEFRVRAVTLRQPKMPKTSEKSGV